MEKWKGEVRKDTQGVPPHCGALEPSWLGKQPQDLKIPSPQWTMLWVIIHGFNSCHRLQERARDIPEITVRCGPLPHPPFPLEFQQLPNLEAKFVAKSAKKKKYKQNPRKFTLGLGIWGLFLGFLGGPFGFFLN